MTHSLDDALVEKVARAIYVAQRATLGLEPTPDAMLDEAVLDEVAALPAVQTVARAALEAAGVAELREALSDAHAAVVASNGYIALLQAYVEATELFLLTQDGAICGLSGGSDDPGRGAKKAWDKFVSARIAIGEHEAALTNQGKAQG